MKRLIRAKISSCASGLEMVISSLVLIGIAISCVALFIHIQQIIDAFTSNTTSSQAFDGFLAFGIQLIIAVEFVKMLSKHTPGSTIEVLLVVIAKRVVVDDLKMFDILMGVIAIAILFLIRKYLSNSDSPNTISGEVLFDATTTVEEFNKITGANLPLDLGDTLGEMIEREFAHTNRELRVHEWMKVGHAALFINEMRDGHLYRVEALREEDMENRTIPTHVLLRNLIRTGGKRSN
ncbi:MAG: hypothetical protein ACOX7F_07490 [Eubacteriales bacterium]|jgi:hypothetical protein